MVIPLLPSEDLRMRVRREENGRLAAALVGKRSSSRKGK